MESQRRCPGPKAGKSCGAWLSKVNINPHTLCTTCRGKVFSPASTCTECESWPELQWALHGTKKKKASKRSPRKPGLVYPLTSPSAPSESGSPSPSPTQSRGRGKSVTGKQPIAVPHESDFNKPSCIVPTQTSEESAVVTGVLSVDEVLVPAGPVSSEDPAWGRSGTPAPSPPSWHCFSGTAVSGGDQDRKRRATCSSDPDSIVWTAPRTPFRSPMRQDEEFSRGSLLTPPVPSVALPPDFKQPVTPEAQLQAPMLVAEDSGASDSSSSSFSSDDTSSASSSSLEDSSDREMRKKKKKSSSNSGPSRKKAKVA
ncbi:nucleolar and coiled-body phosphoprotein 1-like [Palaemon carinicauda]|uniref:nucleolar and coiled-body phosphoprotein 1-like n=1 Tax=Palaemon carinicauda TaxID=392227 RepID=UPI0035B66189